MQGFVFIPVNLKEVFLHHMKCCQFLFAYACAEFIFNGGDPRCFIEIDISYSFKEFKKSLDAAADLGRICMKY